MKTFFQVLALIMVVLVVASCKDKKATEEKEMQIVAPYSGDLPLDSLILPKGFKVDVFVDGLDGARSMAMGDDGTLFVGTRTEGTLYALPDKDKDYRADRIVVLDTGMNVPNGLAFRKGALFVAEVDRLLRFDGIEENLDETPEPAVVYDDYPDKFHHGWKYIAFGPDDKLYVPVGAPCNICDSTTVDERYATITRMNPDGSDREIFAHGVRNTVGFTWHPETKELWFTDNGRDMMGDDIPPCELNRASEIGQHFGYPFCHGGTVKDPEFGNLRPCDDFVAPAKPLDAHVAPLGVKFYRGDMFPSKYKDYVFVAEHGSWNRSKKSGYRIMMLKLEDDKIVSYEPFIEGWLNHDTQERWGRPVDMLVLDDGSMLISDDFGDAIYRITYEDDAVAGNFN
ncbi:PQQ-dependent sugar dehydrogenase [Croceivirga thetidis]|uniref:Sorbosone dehydrogenase family protein n=1 Tax=Croceivirga thetidis TaxID=2721623 RepID=A0ABX1GTJ1_9FLAO|nr:sorbosone dehydrogenase family protein [Croceivirga thetidis]NKI32331.1 sorbosone dehydrogenase family protein [Croceivirga thetidis]